MKILCGQEVGKAHKKKVHEQIVPFSIGFNFKNEQINCGFWKDVDARVGLRKMRRTGVKALRRTGR